MFYGKICKCVIASTMALSQVKVGCCQAGTATDKVASQPILGDLVLNIF